MVKKSTNTQSIKSIILKFAKRLAILGVVMLLFIFLVSKWLLIYTHHDEAITVPDFKGMSIAQVKEKCRTKKLLYEIRDTVYSSTVPQYSVLDQNPKPKEQVKRNRHIYITLSTTSAPLVSLPIYKDVSLRQAINLLENRGLISGVITRKPYPSPTVFEMKFEGKLLQPGDAVPKGSAIDMLVGDGGTNGEVKVPNLVGMTLEEARFTLTANNLNVGALRTRSGAPVSDNIAGKVYKQTPPSDGRNVSQGEPVDIWFDESPVTTP